MLDHSETLEHKCAQDEGDESLHLIREHAEVSKPLQCLKMRIHPQSEHIINIQDTTKSLSEGIA